MTEKPDASASLTPMLRQYLETKERHPDAILFYRIGDFYEMFYDDAVIASKILDIVLTSRNKNDPNPVPLCGIPYHAMQPYLKKLVEKGYKVAICEQVEDPKAAKGVVRREVTRIVTPGVAGFLEGELSDARSANVLAALFCDKNRWGIAFLDVTTGHFQLTEVSDGYKDELQRIAPRELLLTEEQKGTDFGLEPGCCVTPLSIWIWDESYARKILYEQFGVSTLSGFDCEGYPAAVIAAGAVLHYVKETQRVSRLPHLTSLTRYKNSSSMILGEESRRNLNVPELLELIDKTKTAMGRRQLREWFQAPLIQKTDIEARLDAVDELRLRAAILESIQRRLEAVYDLEKINSRLALGTANARDLRALANSLASLQALKPALTEFRSETLKNLSASWNPFSSLHDELEKSLADELPQGLKEGGLIRDGIHPELDELRRLRSNAKGSIAAIEEKERKRTGIGSLKVHFNRVFGYYLEVSTAHLAKVPADYIRKQTLANAERYITQELKEFEDKVLGAEERIKSLEYELFCTLREKVLGQVPELQTQAGRIAALDALSSLSLFARETRSVRPQMEDDGRLEIRGGRHPIVERNLPPGTFVPNDLVIDNKEGRLLMITGPNMAGKSTVIRLAGVITLMAQAGSFVTADFARVGIVDRLYTRVGAGDRIARNESTFMVEMCETAAILHHATDRSLILLDEIGRGTSTFDGISIAWAVAEYIHDQIQARTLFATHYHELADLALTRPGIKNFNVAVQEDGGDVTFLYRLVPGGMSHSYGIHVAKLAGLPVEVVERAKEVLKNLEQGELEPGGQPRLGKKRKKDEGQMNLL